MKYTVQTILSKRLPVNGKRQDREVKGNRKVFRKKSTKKTR